MLAFQDDHGDPLGERQRWGALCHRREPAHHALVDAMQEFTAEAANLHHRNLVGEQTGYGEATGSMPGDGLPAKGSSRSVKTGEAYDEGRSASTGLP